MAKSKQQPRSTNPAAIAAVVEQALTNHVEVQVKPVTEKHIQNEMNIKSLLEQHGISVTDEQVALLSTNLTFKHSKGGNHKHYKHGEVKLEPTTKIALQARIALENLEDGMNLADWAAKTKADKRFVSKQETSKIIAYYQKDLIEKGFLVKA